MNFLFGDAADDDDALGDVLTFGFEVWCESESRWWIFLVGDDDRDTLGDGARVEEEVVEVVDEAVPFEWKNSFGVPLLF